MPSISHVGTTATKISGTGTGTAISSVLPSGIASGDVLILEIGDGLDPGTLPDPSGWSFLRRISDPGTAPAEAAISIWWKAAGSSESAPSLTAPTATRWHSIIRAFRGVDTVNPFIAENAVAETSSVATHTAPTLTNTDAGAWGLFSLCTRQIATPYTAVPGAGLTERIDQDTSNTGTTNTLYEAADSNGPVATGSVSYSATGSGNSTIAVMWAALLRPAAAPPGSVLSIGSAATNHFDVQVAPDTGGVVVTHTQAEIAAGYAESPYFVTNAAGDAVQFRARLDAPTTAGSSFSRCELREVNADGTAAQWDPRTGDHVLQGTTTITSLPPVKPEVVIAQAFGIVATADIMSIRTQLVSGTIRLRARVDGVSITTTQIASPYSVGTLFNWKMRLTAIAREFYWSFASDPLPSTPQISVGAASDTGAYFKAGLYNQSNTAAGDAGTAVGSAELKSLLVSHSAGSASTQGLLFFF